MRQRSQFLILTLLGTTGLGAHCDDDGNVCVEPMRPNVLSAPNHTADLNTPEDYTLIFDQDVLLRPEDIHFARISGTGAPGTPALQGSGSIYTVEFDPTGWVEGDEFLLTVDAGVTSIACDTPLGTSFDVAVSARDLCSGAGPATATSKHYAHRRPRLAGALHSHLQRGCRSYHRRSVPRHGDRNHLPPGPVSLSGSGSTYSINFATAGWTTGDEYTLTVHSAPTAACDVDLAAPFSVDIEVTDTDPCAGDTGPTVTSPLPTTHFLRLRYPTT